MARCIQTSCRPLMLSGAALVCFLLTIGCGRKPAAVPGGGTAVVPPSTIGQTAATVSEAEAQDFAAKFVNGVIQNDPSGVAAVFDWDTLAERGLEGVPLDNAAKTGAKTGLLQSLTQNNSLIQQIHQQLQQGGTYKLLKIHEVDGVRYAMLRLLPAGGGVNYHDVTLAKSADGTCRGIDMHIFATGELMSVTLKRMMLQLAASQNRNVVERLVGRDQLMIKHQQEVLALVRAVQQGNGAEGIRIYHQLPEEVRQEKTLLILRLQAAQSTGNDDEYLQTLTDFRRYHASDACIDFLSIDYFLLKKDYQAALAALAAVKASVDGDPYLDLLQGNIQAEAGNFAEAAAAFRTATDSEPELLDAWWGRVTAALKTQKHEDVLSLLKAMDVQFTIEWNDLTETEDYAGFVQSPFHQQWLDYLAQKQASPASP